jgi:hypothetical protein
MQRLSRWFALLGGLALGLALAGCAAAPEAPEAPAPAGPHVTYAVHGRAAEVLSAVTPYDDVPEAREAFLAWFKRGFETAAARREPLRVEWERSPAGQAASRGYALGLDEGGRWLAEGKPGGRSPRTAPIGPFDGLL